MNAITADAVTADVGTSETTTSTSYTDLATTGPDNVQTLVSGQGCLVFMRALALNSVGGSGFQTYFSYAVSGATTLAAADASSASTSFTTSGNGNSLSSHAWFVATGSGSHTFRMKYKVAGASTGTFSSRRLTTKKF